VAATQVYPFQVLRCHANERELHTLTSASLRPTRTLQTG
jgi:hypothetical protein